MGCITGYYYVINDDLRIFLYSNLPIGILEDRHHLVTSSLMYNDLQQF